VTLAFDPQLRGENRAALYLAKVRYDEQVRSFVGQSEARLKFAKTHIEKIAAECASEMGADEDYVLSNLRELISAEMKFDPKGLPSGPGSEELPELEGVERTNVLDHGAVLEESAYEFGEKTDLGEYTKKSCVRCDQAIETDEALCGPCSNAILAKVAEYGQPGSTGQPQADDFVDPQNENIPHHCICGLTFPTKQDALAHAEHCPQVQQKMREEQSGMAMQPQTAAVDDEPVDVGGDDSVADRFDAVVQEVADREAAISYSRTDDDTVQQIAQQYGLDEDTVRDKLDVIATFGDYTAVNGSLSDEADTDGKSEVTLENGTVSGHEALVPVNMALHKVAEDLGMTSQLVEDMVRERYGGVDLPDKYHASVTGERRLFLPSDLVSSES
jgi:hypothetical protein